MPFWNQDFLDEVQAKESPFDPAYPGKGKPLGPARVAGRLIRGLVVEPVKQMGDIWDRAYAGKATMEDAIGGTLMAINPSVGPGLGAGPRIKAMPWQSRTLDALLGNSQAGKKFPQAATPDTWVSKLKGAGLPGDEVRLASDVLSGAAAPGSKITRDQAAAMLEHKNVTGLTGNSPLPEMGITKTVLGGPEWAAGQKRLEELPGLIADARRLHKADVASNIPRLSPEFKESYSKLHSLLSEQMQLANDAVGKRPRWTQYQLEGVENPREILYHGKSPSGESYTAPKAEGHWGEKGDNLAWHQFEGDLKMPETGKMSTHISGQQSEWIAEHAKTAGEPVYVLEGMDGEVRGIPKRNIEVAGNPDEGFTVMDTTNGMEISHFSTHEEALRNIAEQTGEQPRVPTPPMKENWYKTGLKDAVNRAVESGHDYLSWDTAETMSNRWQDPNEGTHKFFQEHYNQKMGKFLEKEYGVKPEKVRTKTAQLADVPVEESLHSPEVRSVKIDPDYISVENRPLKDGYYLRVPDTRSEHGQGFRATSEIFDTYEEGWKAREKLIKSLKTKEMPDPESPEVWRIPITEEMKRKVLLEGQYFSKKDNVAKPGGKDAQMAA